MATLWTRNAQGQHGGELPAPSPDSVVVRRVSPPDAATDATASVALALRELATCAESILRDMPRDAARAIGSPLRERIAAARAILAQHGEDSSVPAEAARALALTAPLAAATLAPEAPPARELPRHAGAPGLRVLWQAPEAGDESREYRATCNGFALHVWRASPGSWAWGVRRGMGREVVPSYHGAPSRALAQRDAESWAWHNGKHGKPQGEGRPLAPPFCYALRMGDVSRFLTDPGACGFMVAPPESAIAEARRIREARGARIAAGGAETVSGGEG